MNNLLLILVLMFHLLLAKDNLAVMMLDANGVNEEVSAGISENLTTKMIELDQYIVIERSSIDKILKEQKLQQSGCTDTQCAVELGKMLNAAYVVIGSVSRIGSTYTIQCRTIHVETGSALNGASFNTKGEIDNLLDGVDEVAYKLSGIDPPKKNKLSNNKIKQSNSQNNKAPDPFGYSFIEGLGLDADAAPDPFGYTFIEGLGLDAAPNLPNMTSEKESELENIYINKIKNFLKKLYNIEDYYVLVKVQLDIKDNNEYLMNGLRISVYLTPEIYTVESREIITNFVNINISEIRNCFDCFTIEKMPKSSQNKKELANCILLGDIKEIVDFRGNRILSGEIKNIGEGRADFVKINFIFRINWQGKTKSLTAFVRGSKHAFTNTVESDSSIETGAIAKFELVIPPDFETFIGYSYTVDWEQYD